MTGPFWCPRRIASCLHGRPWAAFLLGGRRCRTALSARPVLARVSLSGSTEGPGLVDSLFFTSGVASGWRAHHPLLAPQPFALHVDRPLLHRHGGFLDGRAQRRMGVAGARDVLGRCGEFHRDGCFGDHVARVGPDAYHATGAGRRRPRRTRMRQFWEYVQNSLAQNLIHDHVFQPQLRPFASPRQQWTLMVMPA